MILKACASPVDEEKERNDQCQVRGWQPKSYNFGGTSKYLRLFIIISLGSILLCSKQLFCLKDAVPKVCRRSP